MSESLYEKFERERAESEKEMTRIREATWKMEREKKEKAEATAEQRHSELIESMKKNSGIQISSGGDTNISQSNLTGRDSVPNPSNPNPNRRKVIGWVFGIVAAVIAGLIVAYLKGYFPEFLR